MRSRLAEAATITKSLSISPRRRALPRKPASCSIVVQKPGDDRRIVIIGAQHGEDDAERKAFREISSSSKRIGLEFILLSPRRSECVMTMSPRARGDVGTKQVIIVCSC